MQNSVEARTCEIFFVELCFLARGKQLRGTSTYIPLGLKSGKAFLGLCKIYSIRTRIGAATGRVGDRASRDYLLYDLRQISNLIVLFGQADVEGFVVNGLTPRLECRHKRSTDIFHMDQRSPRRAIRLNLHPPRRIGPTHEIVQ